MNAARSPRRWLWVALAVLALLAYLSTWFEITTGDRRPKGAAADIYGLRFRDDVNVLFVLIDTLRADRLGCYGYERETSPTLDYMASKGLRFSRHLAQSSWTKASMASLWSGLNPARAGVTRFDHGLPEDALLPAEIMREAGFRTTGIWRNGWVAPNFGFGQGFEVYERPQAKRAPIEVRRENPHITLDGTDSDIVDNAIEFLRAHGRDRWFLYLHMMDVHQYVYTEQSALFGSDYSDIYDNSIHHTDTVLGHLLTYLADNELLDKTLVVITSDHGEAFSERGLEGHARHVYRESTEIPLIIGLPFRLEPGLALDLRSSNVDVWPTVLDLLGLPPLEDDDGRSLLPEILAAAEGTPIEEAPEHAIAHLDRTWGQRTQRPRPAVAILEDRFRYVYAPEPKGGLVEQLFDGGSDPLERSDVKDAHPERVERLREAARSYLEVPTPAPWGSAVTRVEIDEMELNQLRALGYELD